MINSDYIRTILEAKVYDRLRDWYNIGPVQRATLDEFIEEIIYECIYVAKRHYISSEPYGGVEATLLKHWKIGQPAQ